MQRHNSKNSISSIGSSSRVGEKNKPSPTHMIIQRENDKQMILLPTTHLVNSSVTRIKLNDTATFKLDLNNRKQERGRILQLGNKEECVEQLQVFEMTADIDGHEKSNVADGSDDENNDSNEEECEKDKRIEVQEPSKKTSTTSVHGRIGVNSGSNRNMSSSSTNKQANDRNKQKENSKAKYSQIDEEPEEQEDDDSEKDLDHMTAKELFDQNVLSNENAGRYTASSIQKQQIRSSSKKSPNKDKDNNKFVSQSHITIGTKSKRMDKYSNSDATSCRTVHFDETELPQIDFNYSELMRRLEETNKKYDEVREKNRILEKENERLFKDNQMLKRNTIPIPDSAARQWLIDTGKSLDVKYSTNIHTHAKALNVDVQELIRCLDNTTTSTARQVVKLLYPLPERLSQSKEIVPEDQRKAIRAFAESHRGPVIDRAMNEAINGVFRSTKSTDKKVQENENTSVLNKNPNGSNQNMNKGQKTLTQMMKTKKQLHLNSSGTILDKENKLDKTVDEENDE
ncbi:hypothetical protein I4U23_004353 [Adineta vaga]|nr:hypothetical protein I4U23_004353 [Adineta vaga]